MACSGNIIEKAGCEITSPITSPISHALGGAASSVISGGLDDIAKQLASAATDLLKALASWFTTGTTINLANAGLQTPLDDIAGLAMIVAFVLLIIAAGQAGVAGSGRPLGTALAGLAKAVVIWVGIVAVVALLLDVADGLTSWIIQQGFGSSAGFENKMTGLFQQAGVANDVGLLFIFALVALFVALALWLEMVFRALGIILLVAGAPMAAVGLMHDSTAGWWPKCRTGLLNLIFLKPIIALVFLVAFGLFGDSTGIFQDVVGIAGLLLAGIAWPVLASFFTFSSTKPGLGMAGSLASGLAGFAAGRATGGGSGGSLSPAYDAAGAEAAADANHEEIAASGAGRGWLSGANSVGGAGGGGAGAGAGAAAGGAAAAVGLAAAAGAAIMDTTTSHMQAMHGHAGLSSGANTQLRIPPTGRGGGSGGGSPDAGGGDVPPASQEAPPSEVGEPESTGPQWPDPPVPGGDESEAPTVDVPDEAAPTASSGSAMNGSSPGGPAPSEPGEEEL